MTSFYSYKRTLVYGQVNWMRTRVRVGIENAAVASRKCEKGLMQVKSYSKNIVTVSWFLGPVLIFSAAFLIQGVPAYAADKDKFSGFLTDYSSLKPAPKGGTKLLWKNQKYRWPDHLASFKAVKIDGIKVLLSKEGQSRGVDATELARLAEELHRQLCLTSAPMGQIEVVA